MDRYRWNEQTHTWEFFEPAFGGWNTLRVGPKTSTRPMTFAEGFEHIVTMPLVRGREATSRWIYDRMQEISIEYVAL